MMLDARGYRHRCDGRIFDPTLSKTDVIRRRRSRCTPAPQMPDAKDMREVLPKSEVTQVAGTGIRDDGEAGGVQPLLTSFLNKIKF